MHQRILLLIGLVSLLVIPLACGSGNGGGGDDTPSPDAPQADYGDAPDGGPTGYPAPFAAVGDFPTLFASNGAHCLNWALAFLGTSASGEFDATDPADPDGVPNLTNTDLDDGLTDLKILLTAIPPPTTLTVNVAALSTTSSERYYLNVLIDLTMDGSWGDVGAGGESEWVVRNLEAVTVPGSAVPVTSPPFAYSNGNLLPDGAWMRLALTPERIEGASWDGTGTFASGEIEDHQVRMPLFNDKSCYLRVDCNGPYRAANGVLVPCRVRNLGRDDCDFDWTVTRIRGDGMDVAPLMGNAMVLAGGVRVVNLTGNRVGNDLPSVWRFNARPDPDSVLVPGGIIAGMGESVSDFEFTTCFEDAESQAMLTFAELLGVDPGALCGSETAKLILTVVHSAATVPSKGVANDHTTLTRIAPTHETRDATWADDRFNNSDFPCGSGPNGYTLCPSPATAVPGGEFLMVHATVEAGIPMSDPTNFYQYAFVFDADGDTTNNYQPAPAFPNDFFQDTDRWYEALYDPSTGWSMRVIDARGGTQVPFPSAARILLNGNALTLVVPRSEFSVENPAWRLSVFRHTGDFGIDPPYDYDGSLWPAVADGLAPYPPEWP